MKNKSFNLIKTFSIILNIVIFLISALFLFLIYAFKDTPAPLPIEFQVFQWFVIIYPFVFLIGLLLSKVINSKFIYLSNINLVVCTIIMCWFLIGILKEPYEADKMNLAKNTEIIKNSSKDFICEDGSYFFIENTESGDHIIIDYFSLFAINNPKEFYVPQIGSIFNGTSNVNIAKYQEKTMDSVKQKLDICKNKDGKTLLEVYPASTN